MNICILTKSTLSHQIGGMEIHVEILSKTAKRLGHSVSVITTMHPEGIEQEEKNGVSYYYLLNTKPSRYSKSWWQESAKKIIELHNQNGFDVIWSESFSGYYYACKLRSLVGIPIISIMQGAGIIGVIRTRWNSIFSLKEFLNFMVKYLYETVFIALPLFWGTLRHSDIIVAVSEQSAEAIQREFFIKPDKFHVIYNSIDTDFFKPEEEKRKMVRKKYSLSNLDRIILMAGVVHRQKGMHIGLQAFRQIKEKVPNCKLMIVGDGPHLKLLKELAERLDIENEVIFCGFVPSEETPFYYAAADLLINPTLRIEGLPFIMAEAMASGLPTVANCIGGVASAVEDGVNGFLVKPRDTKALVKRAIEILNNQQLKNKFGENARKKAVDCFDSKIMTNDYIKLSQTLKKG